MKNDNCKIPDALYNEVIDYHAEELCSSWHPEKPDGFESAINPNYEHDRMIEYYGKYSGGVDVLGIITGFMIHDVEADARALAKRYEMEREIG